MKISQEQTQSLHSPTLKQLFPGVSPDGWYHGDFRSLPLYLDVFEGHQKDDFTRYKLDISPDLRNLSHTVIANLSIQHQINWEQARYSTKYRICKGRPVIVDHRKTVDTYMEPACGPSSLESNADNIHLCYTSYYDFQAIPILSSVC
jgi:hypothetical protein